MRHIHLFALLLTSGLASAQTPDIAGTVLDTSGRPVSGAAVTCGDATGVTDDQGGFVIRGATQCTAKITREGFAPQSAALESGHPARITLTVAELRERITVSALRTETTPEEAGVAGTVFTSADLAQRQYPELATILREVPGLQVTQTGRHGGTTSVFTRGAPSNGTLVMLDGMPLNDPGGAFNFATILAGDIDRIEVIRGPESALFGAEASGGVIQLFSRHGDPERRTPHLSASYDRGTFQTDHWIGRISGGLADRFDYSANVEQYHTVSEFPNDFYRNTTGALNLGYRLTKQTQLRGIFRAYDSTVGSPNKVGYGLFDFDARRRDRDYAALLRVDDVRNSHFVQRFTVGYHKLRDTFMDDIADGPYRVTALVHDDGNRVYLDGLIDPRFPPVLGPGYRLVSRSVTNFASGEFLSITGRTDVDYQGTLTHTGGSLIFGYEFEREHGLISNSDVNRDNHGVFVHKQQTIAGRIYLSGGIRMEQNTVFHTKLTARGAASVKLVRSTFVRFSAARGITEPSLYQNFVQSPFAVGNPRLRPEKTNSYEAGIVQEWFGRRVRTEVNLFRSSFHDLIAFVGNSWLNVNES